METLYYSTGQVARQLGTTQAAVRVMCESRAIAAETTPGGQWRVSAPEVARLKRDGLPQIPRSLPLENKTARSGVIRHNDYEAIPESPSEVALAANHVAIRRSSLERRRIDREIEENEDWFRDRQREQAIAEAAERERSEAQQAQHRREEWRNEWIRYALNSAPYDARQEVAIEIHAAVESVLSRLESSNPDMITQRLVDAGVHRALVPWQRKKNIERALQASVDKLPSDVRSASALAPLRQLAWEAAVAAAEKVREEAGYPELESAAVQAVRPMIQAYEHDQLCQRIIGRVIIWGAKPEEAEEARRAVYEAVTLLPISAGRRELERASETAVAPFKAAITGRRETERLESERQSRRRTFGFRVERHLTHIAKYLEQEYKFDGGWQEIHRDVKRLRPAIREALIDELLKKTDMTDAEIRKHIEGHIDREA